MPHLADLEKKHPNIDFIAVHSGANTKTKTNYTVAEVKNFLKSVGKHPKQVYWVAENYYKKLGFNSYPNTIIVDKDFKIVKIIRGYSKATLATLENFLENGKSTAIVAIAPANTTTLGRR